MAGEGLVTLRSALESAHVGNGPTAPASSGLVPLRAALTARATPPTPTLRPAEADLPDTVAAQRGLSQGIGGARLASDVAGPDFRESIAPLVGAAQVGLGGLNIYNAATGSGSPVSRGLAGASGALGVVSGASKIPAVTSAVPGLKEFGDATLGSATGLTAPAVLGQVPLVPAIGTALDIAGIAASNQSDSLKAAKSVARAGLLAAAAPTGGLSLVATPVVDLFIDRTEAMLKNRLGLNDAQAAAVMLNPAFHALGGPLLGLLFGGGRPQLTHAQREARDVQDVSGVLGGLNWNVGHAETPKELYDWLAASKQNAGGAGLAVPTFLNGVPDQYLTWPAGRSRAEIQQWWNRTHPGEPIPARVGPVDPQGWYPTVLEDSFAKLVRDPAWMPASSASVQLGVDPQTLAPMNRGLGDTTTQTIRAVRAFETLRPSFDAYNAAQSEDRRVTMPQYARAASRVDPTATDFRDAVEAVRLGDVFRDLTEGFGPTVARTVQGRPGYDVGWSGDVADTIHSTWATPAAIRKTYPGLAASLAPTLNGRAWTDTLDPSLGRNPAASQLFADVFGRTGDYGAALDAVRTAFPATPPGSGYYGQAATLRSGQTLPSLLPQESPMLALPAGA